MAYLHYEDRPPYQVVFTVRGSQPADQLIPGVREAIWQYAPETTIARVKTLDSQLNDSLAAEQLQTTILSAFAVSALLLAMLGIYGVLSCSVAARTQEIGLRMALGASRGQMYALTFAEAIVPFVVGLAAGLVAGALAARAVHGLLYEFRMIDPSVDAMVAGVLFIAASVAAFLPARRAASVEPMEALRSE
jgi:ABC-type antimicrobial peptide transport system permease subunit